MILDFLYLRDKNVQRCTSEKGFNHPLSGWSVGEWGVATAGELGEACNIAKKLLRVRDGVKGNKETEDELKDKLALEMADTIIYLDLWAASQGINLQNAIIQAFNNKSREIGSDIKL